MTDRQCPLCRSPVQTMGPVDKEIKVGCERCGEYLIDKHRAVDLASKDLPEITRAGLSHAARRMTRENRSPKISWKLIEGLLDSPHLPTPDEQAENLILLLGDTLAAPAEFLDVYQPSHEATVGVLNREGLDFIVHAMNAERLIEFPSTHNVSGLTLTYYGWRRYEELRRGRSDSRKAFMAMPFRSPELDMIYSDCFKVAVLKTGFHLERLDEEPKAGSIDNRLRVEIRTAKFLIAELPMATKECTGKQVLQKASENP